jgi:rhodanese-related sulfurtransferase
LGVVLATLPGMDGDYTPQEVAQLLQTSDVQLIDVRQPHEHEAGRIQGGRLIELMMLTSQADTIDRDRPVIFYCRSGSRSAMATEAFLDAGYDAHNMVGGLVQWEATGLPLEPEGGYVEMS